MSHFTVLVAANSEEELEAKLQPYHEYECTGVKDQYVVFVGADMEEAEKEWSEEGSRYDSFDEFMEDWYGYQLVNGVWGHYTNPCKKWDWWTIGGRWSGTLLLKDGSTVDYALNKDIDWEGMKHKAKCNAQNRYQNWHRAKTLPERDRDRFMIKNEIRFLDNSEVEQLETLTEALYADIRASEPLTFAFVDQSGAWFEQAKMGWWGMTSDPCNEASPNFWSFVESLSPNQGLFVVDCHI